MRSNILSDILLRRDFNIKTSSQRILFSCCFLLIASTCLGQMHIVVDQVGYETTAQKQALVVADGAQVTQDAPETFTLTDADTGKVVLTGPFKAAGQVDQWGRTFWLADFSSVQKPGHYKIAATSKSGAIISCEFSINQDVLERNTLSNIVYYFKGQRATGDMNRADAHLRLPDGSGYVDLSGGWYDATGDYGIHLSHQNPTSYFNPQQVPLVAWACLESYRVLKARNDDNFTEYERRLLDEGLFGADFLVRMKRPGGSFFESISAPGMDKLAKDRAIGNPNTRTKIKTSVSDSTERIGAPEGPYAYQASFRAGGGMSIAALALASTMPISGDMDHAAYLKAAEDAFAFLSTHNRELLNDGKENILDDYCALMAATELYRATNNEMYLKAADERANHLMGRLISVGKYHNYWRADDGTRPFFHPSDAGLPVISLLEYAQIASPAQQARVHDAVSRSLHFELWITSETNNPFGYARQLVRMSNGTVRSAYFFPHDTEAAPWWQGEDARLASLAAAARMAAPLYNDNPAFQRQLETYAWNQLHWILGRNPFDASMLVGSGHGNAPYMFFKSYKYTNAPGAIINGVTAGFNNEDGIAFNEGFARTGLDEDWRWTEEWLPHDAWYLYAVSLPHN
ncbi:MAG TPA: glycoside hydrolase family 9 protein [Acidobacteriaceae bacterium]